MTPERQSELRVRIIDQLEQAHWDDPDSQPLMLPEVIALADVVVEIAAKMGLK